MPAIVSTGNIGKRIRDTERLLRQRATKLSADVLQEQTRKLAALRARSQATVSNNINGHRYKMVRFVESKKAVRKLHQALKSENKAAVEEAKKDCLYIQFFPQDLKYISLYVPTMLDETEIAKRSELRSKIFEEHCGEEIKLPGMNQAAGSSNQGKKSGKVHDEDDEDEDDDEDDEGEDEEDEIEDEDDEEDESADEDDDGDDDDESEFDSEDDEEDDEDEDEDDEDGDEYSEDFDDDDSEDDDEEEEEVAPKKQRR